MLAYMTNVICILTHPPLYCLSQMFPQIRTSSSANIQHPTLNPQAEHVPSDSHFIISQHSTPNPQAEHVPSDAHFIISQHSTPNPQTEHVPSDAHFVPLENYFHENNLE